MAKYAANTSVSSTASRGEIEKTLTRYGATSFVYGWEAEHAVIGFTLEGKQIRFILPLPDRNSREFTHTPVSGTPRSVEASSAEFEKAVRQRWRALALVVKAKLEAVESGIFTFEEEFYAHLVLPGGKTVFEASHEMVGKAIEDGSSGSFMQAMRELGR